MAIEKSDFEFVCNLVRQRSGIVLEAGKEYLVEARLGGLLRPHKLDSMHQLIGRLRASVSDPLNRLVVEAMTTNETSFFRDVQPFETLKSVVLPALLARNAMTRTLNIWCGASSTGQEPYTMAMVLHEAIPKIADWKINFIATDISSEMIARSRAGKYNQIEINRGLPATMMVKYFDKHGLDWQVKEPLRKMIDFREMNLTAPWNGMNPMDIVFMRNVLIYFDTPTKQNILARLRQVLKPDGYLFLGCAETTMSLDDCYQRMSADRSGCYRLKQAVSNAA
jgi:chemotaxis protein methyltransferase CheR